MLRLALAALTTAAPLLAVPALAGDGSGLKLPGTPGLLYEFDERRRGGVTVADDATLELRFDGCWTSTTTISNESAAPRSVAVSVQFLDENGAPLDSVPVVAREPLEPGATRVVSRTNCSAALEASYSLQRCWQVRRFVSAR